MRTARKRAFLGGWLAASALSLGVTVIPALAQNGGNSAVPPVKQWSKGDWWEVQLEQQMLHLHGPGTTWNKGARLHFTVIASDKASATVEVTTVPMTRIPEKLLLVYNNKGELTAAQVVNVLGSAALGKAGSRPGVFGMLGKEAFDLSKSPTRKARDDDDDEDVEVGDQGKGRQKWSGGDAFWKEYRSNDDLPQHGKRSDGQWKNKGKEKEKD